MFDKLKQLREIKKLRDSLSKEKIEVEKNGVKVVLNGKMEVEEIQLNSDLGKEEQEKILCQCFNEAVRKIQMILAKKMSLF
ncbi:YbaB/EbfC family nucleoid-associated protein [bacterium]|nr:YbaB/EbfC family nucleoid-associated protein [bacterium]